jgi:Flp pilus assembly protein TadD
MNLQRDEEARTDLECAVALDMLYATPHVNLAILAAQNGDEPVARKELEMAQELGYRSEGAQKLVRMALAKANQAIGDKLS